MGKYKQQLEQSYTAEFKDVPMKKHDKGWRFLKHLNILLDHKPKQPVLA